MVPSAKPGFSCATQGSPLPSSSVSFGVTLVMAIACGVAAANIYYNQPMLGIMEAAFPGQVTVIELVPTATQLGFESIVGSVYTVRQAAFLIQKVKFSCNWRGRVR
jgi:hypothetical protein